MAWLSGWSYRKKITIDGTADGAQTDYQMLLNVNSGSGSDSGDDVFLESHCTDFPNDIQFTQVDGTTTIDYWVEDAAADPCPMWIEFNAIADGGGSPSYTEFYIYYGKTGQATSTNGANTFIQFDDFEWGNNGDPIDDSGGSITWTIAAGDVDISTGQAYKGTRSMKLIGGATPPNATTPQTPGTNYAIRCRIYKETAVENMYPVLHGDGSTRILAGVDLQEDIAYYDTAWRDTGVNSTADTWKLWEINDLDWSGNTYDIIHAGSRAKDDAGMQSSALQANVIACALGGIVANADGWIDDFIVRKWTDNEPTWGTWGSEEREIYQISGVVIFQDPAIV